MLFARSPSFCVLTCPSLCSLVNAPLSRRGETGKIPRLPRPPPLLAVIAKCVHCAARTCRTQQAKKVWDEKIAMNGFLCFQVLDTLCPPPFHNSVSKLCPLKTNVRSPRTQTNTHRSTASSCPSGTHSPSCRRCKTGPRCARTSMRSMARSTGSTSPSSVPFSGYVPPLFTTLSRSSVR